MYGREVASVTRCTFTLLAIIAAAALPSTAVRSQTARQNDRVSRREMEQLARLDATYRAWLAEDVPYIITNAERKAFLSLATDDERDQFIEQFWQQRNPEPGFPDTHNSFKEEHYRRIAYANEHLTKDMPGWQSDRGRVYITWGPPDEIQIGPSENQRLARWEVWRYRYLEGVGENVELQFVDTLAGDYRLRTAPELVATLTDMPQVWQNEGFHGTGVVTGSVAASVGFKALEAVVVARVVRNDVLFSYDFDYSPVTHFTTLVPLTIEVPESELRKETGEQEETPRLNLFCRITNSKGRVVETIYDWFPHSSASSTPGDSARAFSLRKSIPLRPDSYDLSIVVCSPKSGKVGSVFTKLNVPSVVAGE
jgi:GWxTD domain-containing protein